MFYEVFDGDTVYMDVIDPVWVFPKGRKAARPARTTGASSTS